nr:monofunctional riboflavin biosynthesis protein RIBA 3, chloroplastic [Tanacetum cinerariifolium]
MLAIGYLAPLVVFSREYRFGGTHLFDLGGRTYFLGTSSSCSCKISEVESWISLALFSSKLCGSGSVDTSKAFKTVDDFFVSDTVGDPDCPTDGFSSIKDALATLRLGKFVIIGDDKNGDIERNIVFAASFATPQTIGFLMGHGLGIISVGMTSENLERLNLPLMSLENEHNSVAPSFTVTLDAIDTSIGVSSSDRAKTILALASPTSRPAYVDLVKLADLDPVYVLLTIVNTEDGSIAPLNKLRKLALYHGIPLVLIADLIRYRRKRERLVERVTVSRLPTTWGLFEAYCYQSKLDGTEYIVVVNMLSDIGVQTMRLMTNNPAKFTGRKEYGLAIVERVPVMTPITDENRRYLETKRTKMGHIYGSDILGALDFKDAPNIDL